MDLIRDVRTAFMMRHSQYDPYNTDHMYMTQVALAKQLGALPLLARWPIHPEVLQARRNHKHTALYGLCRTTDQTSHSGIDRPIE